MIRNDYAVIPEAVLDTLFDVTGYFYVEPKTKDQCRKFLNIKIKGEGLELPPKPDLMVVMMNPGKSAPLNGDFDGRVEVPASPDSTQYRIMKVMLAKDYKFARILNLSDYREKDSNQFTSVISVLERLFPEHTIFHPNRANDFNSLYNTSVKLIVGWGCDDKFKNLATLALSRVNTDQLVGVRHANESWAYHHPGRHGDWVGKIVRKL